MVFVGKSFVCSRWFDFLLSCVVDLRFYIFFVFTALVQSAVVAFVVLSGVAKLSNIHAEANCITHPDYNSEQSNQFTRFFENYVPLSRRVLSLLLYCGQLFMRQFYFC